jgi:hypothetical protein
MTTLLDELPARVLPPAVVEGAGVVQWVLDDLLGDAGASGFDGLTDEQLREAVESWHRVEAGVGAVKLRLLALAERRGTARAAGAASTAAWASSLTHQDGDDAHRQVTLAGHLDDTCTTTRTALGEGRISARHAEVIAEAQRRLPAWLDTEQRGRVERGLVDRAERMSPRRLRVAARRALEAVERDAAVVDAHEDALLRENERVAYDKTRLSLHDNGDGTVSGHFTVPDLHGQLLRKILESMTAPRRGRLGASQVQAGDRGIRTDWDHARGLALCELVEHLPTDRLPGKVAATLVVQLDKGVLDGVLRAAGLDTGGRISAGQARRLACGAGLLPAVLGGASHVLDLGWSKRLFSEAQRVACGLSHASCAAHGCERPFAWCELHHRRPWSAGGSTNLADAVPLCWFHHRRIHDPSLEHRYRPDGSVTFHRRP